MNIAIIIGTRPELIKMAPVIRVLKLKKLNTIVCSTGQHKNMLHQSADELNINIDIDLEIMIEKQSLSTLSANCIIKLQKLFDRHVFDWVLVQGDTTSAFMASLVSFYNRIKVAHIEAGLRSFNNYSPFPEEVNRKGISGIADLHFTPTAQAKLNLLNEGISEKQIIQTGNTGIDSLLWMKDKIKNDRIIIDDRIIHAINSTNRIILCTTHRRENWETGIEHICYAILEIINTHKDVIFILPVHMNPIVKNIIYNYLGDQKQVILTPPLNYSELVFVLSKSFIVMSDSGGIQEEAPTFHVPVLVLRENTERPEGVEANVSKIVGTEIKKIVRSVNDLLSNPEKFKKMSEANNPYGDGNSAELIVKSIIKHSTE